MGFSLKGLLGTAAGIAPYALSEMRQQDAINNANDDRMRSDFYKSQANDRANQQETREAALTDAQIKNLGNDSEWEDPKPVDTGTGPMLVQRNKRTGELRPATLGGSSAPVAPSIAGPQITPSAPAPTPMLPGGPSLAASVPKQAPTAPATAPAPLSARVAGGPTPLRPYVKPPVAAIPYNLTPAGMAADSTLHAKNAQAEAPYKKDPNAAPTDHFVFPTETDSTGKNIVYRGNTATGELAPTGVNAKAASTGGAGSVSAQAQQARLLAAVSEARLADERMRAYEDKLLHGSATISPLEQAAGSLTTNLSDSHSVFGALTQAGSEMGLNKSDSEYAQYLRDAATIGRAEQMMSPRGGNETMVRANALLSRAGTGAMANTINASRMARQALFGQSGGIAQTLTPGQNAKLGEGITRIKAGDTGAPGGNIHLGGPVTPTERKALKAQGFTDAQIDAIKP
jgi:hypothetical protein